MKEPLSFLLAFDEFLQPSFEDSAFLFFLSIYLFILPLKYILDPGSGDFSNISEFGNPSSDPHVSEGMLKRTF